MSTDSNPQNNRGYDDEDPMQDPDDLRQLGNHQFAKQNYEMAVAFYSQAIDLLEQKLEQELEQEQQEREQLKQSPLLTCLCNRSAAYFQMEMYDEAKADAECAWTSLPQLSNIKAAYRLIKTLIAMSKYEEGKQLILQVFQVLEEVETKAQTGESTDTHARAFDDLLKTIDEKRNQTPSKISIRDFSLDQELGFGNFSEIYKVTHKQTGKTFALKRINKKKIADLGKKQHPNVFNEVKMEKALLCDRINSSKGTSHPFIIQMHAAFDDYEHVYYLMDLHITCGDLWSQLKHGTSKKMVGCHRSQTKQWTYQLVDAIEHMHKNGIVHRDLKPENILLNERNHVVVIDFGTAKDLIYTNLNGPEFVGTPDFMSPEAVKGGRAENQHRNQEEYPDAGCGADLWALGAIVYIMHTGETPFWSPSPFLTFLKIKRGNLTRGWGVADDDAWDFIRTLVQVNPKDRIGSNVYQVNRTKRIMEETIVGGYDCLREHSYLQDFHEQPLEIKIKNPIPSLRDLAIRACVEMAKWDSQDYKIMEDHPPGDGSHHDLLRLSLRDRYCVMHLCDKLQLFKVAGDSVGQQPSLYSRFYKDIVQCRIFSKYKERLGTHDFCGLTQMNDGHGRTPASLNEDPYATPIKVEPVKIAVLSNPLFCSRSKDFDDDTRKRHKKDLKSNIAAINRARPKIVIVNGAVDDSKKILARISDSIPVVVNEGKGDFYSAWYWAVQCITISSINEQVKSNRTPQMVWLREQLEAARMSKHVLFVFVDGDPRDLPKFVQKRIARGRASALIGHCRESDGPSFTTRLKYDHKTDGNACVGTEDDFSIRSTGSDDEDMDDHVTEIMGSRENAIRWITIQEDNEWKQGLDTKL